MLCHCFLSLPPSRKTESLPPPSPIVQYSAVCQVVEPPLTGVTRKVVRPGITFVLDDFLQGAVRFRNLLSYLTRSASGNRGRGRMLG